MPTDLGSGFEGRSVERTGTLAFLAPLRARSSLWRRLVRLQRQIDEFSAPAGKHWPVMAVCTRD